MKTKKNKDDCTELKNIKYQNMLLSNSKISEEVKENILRKYKEYRKEKMKRRFSGHLYSFWDGNM